MKQWHQYDYDKESIEVVEPYLRKEPKKDYLHGGIVLTMSEE
jgi:hypothetical protein